LLIKPILFLITFFTLFSWIPYSQEKDDTILEKVGVVNVEVPVRVVYKGKPVDNLKKSDFRLYEDKKPVEINGFFIKKKRIKVEDVRLKSSIIQSYKSRYFVLVFNIIDYNFHIKDGLDFIFKNVLRDNDQLMVLANNKIVFFNSLNNKEEIYNKVNLVLKNQGLIAKNNLLSCLKKFGSSNLSSIRKFDTSHYSYYEFLKNYLESWREYKRNYLTPDINKYYHFAKHLQNLKKEKWVINFYQLELFPQMKIQGILNAISNLIGGLESSEDGEKIAFAKILSRIVTRITKEINVENLFPTEEVSKLFCNVGATFHSIFIPTTIDTMSKNFEYKRVASALQNNLREITKRTGGTLIITHNLESAITTIGEKEDIYYILTYVPHNPLKAGKIKIKTKDKRYKLFYDDNIRANYIEAYLKEKESKIPMIGIKDAGFEKSNLFFRLEGIMLKEIEGEKKGNINIHILIKDEENKTVYDKSKTIFPVNSEININIKTDWLKKGNYSIVVEANDLLTGKSYLEYIQAEISKTKTRLKRVEFKEDELVKPKKELTEDSIIKNKELEKYLKGAAEYCERLKKRAFHFICKEKVSITIKKLNRKTKYTAWKGATGSKYWNIRQHTISYLFDYQLISNRGQLKEQRRLITRNSINDKKVSVKNLVVSFLIERPVFGPRTLLSIDRQQLFEYEILRTIKQKNHQFVVIRVIPKKVEEVFFSSGEVWIDSDDFSVRKIQVTPRYIQGYEKLIKKANRLKTRLFLNCEIQYNQNYRDLYFPTEVSIVETYKGGPNIRSIAGINGLERTRTIFKYEDYKFFDVNTDVQYE